ncbi:MAG: hypothetical protein M3O70_20320 [Actinomycetota bacterium]|nr:hypothetical protein [Actinomycetota bacterium]
MKFIVDVTLEKLDYDEDPAEVAARLMAILVQEDIHGVESINGVEVSSEAGEQQPHEKGSGVNP